MINSRMVVGQFVWFGVGGADRAAENLVRGLLCEPSIDLVVFYNEFSFPKYCSMHDPGVKILSRWDNYKDLQLIKIDNVVDLNKHSLDVLNTHRPGNDSSVLPGFESTQFNFKVVETNFHGRLKTKADYRVFPSSTMIKNVNVTCPYKIIPNPTKPPATLENLRGELGIQNKFVFGRFATPGNTSYSNINLQAYKKVENSNTVFIYVFPSNQAKIDIANLRIKNIIFLDQTIDEVEISKMYNTFDVLCHGNSYGETFGNTIAEAMIHGKPVISHVGARTWSQAQPELLGDCAELFITQDIVNNYAKGMQRLMTDRQYYLEVSAYLKGRADALYDYRIVTKQYVDVYRTVIA